METKHTPGPWTAHDDDGTGTLPCVLYKTPTGSGYVAQCNSFNDARRIVACVNACAGVNDPAELKQDAARLDFCISNSAYRVMGSDARGWRVFDCSDGLIIIGNGKTARNAIDDAMVFVAKVKRKPK